ncbi:hypothetical protein NQ317_016747 [Molorchus minor]|uniref:Uncharacterized protein n=1 Tax=Molorchus minor TaxID=1323400 RepID=A0ABQ9J110_9CUCU|nr:hypothetical protein NQ317_016747 [Molorchus minor]
MEEQYDLARGRLSVANAKDAYKKLLAELTHRFNSLGLGEGFTEKWQKARGVNGLNDNNLPQIQFLSIYAIYC